MGKWAEHIRKRVLETNTTPTTIAMDINYWYKLADLIEEREREGKDYHQIFGELVVMIADGKV